MSTTSKSTVQSRRKQGSGETATLWQHFDGLLRQWSDAFRQHRTWRRATELLTALVATEGRSTLTNAICFLGREQDEWSANYRVFNNKSWKLRQLFEVVLREAINELPSEQPVVVAIDDTVLPKVGTRIDQARWCHNALAPKFLEKQICWGIRMLHAAILIPNYVGHRPLAISVGFEPRANA